MYTKMEGGEPSSAKEKKIKNKVKKRCIKLESKVIDSKSIDAICGNE